MNASLQPSGPAADRAATLVRAAQPQDAERWNAFVRQHPDGTFFHLAQWREVLHQAFGHRSHYLIAERDGRVCGVLPLVHVRSRLFGNALVSTPFCVYGGIVSEDEAAQRVLAERACELARQLGVDYLELRNAPATVSRLADEGPLRHVPQADRCASRSEHDGNSAQATRHGAQRHPARA